MNGIRYLASTAPLETQSARNTVPSGVRNPVMSNEWPGSGTGSSSRGNAGSPNVETSLGCASRNLFRSSAGGQPPYRNDGSRSGSRVNAPLDPGSKDAAAGAFLQKPVPADMVRVRMGVDDRPQTPPFSFQSPERPFAGVPVVAAVDQADVRPVQQADADLRRTIDIPAAFSGANQFIHRAFPPVFHQYTPATPEKQGTRLAPEPQRAYIEP